MPWALPCRRPPLPSWPCFFAAFSRVRGGMSEERPLAACAQHVLALPERVRTASVARISAN
jgi:hypothetical protein